MMVSSHDQIGMAERARRLHEATALGAVQAFAALHPEFRKRLSAEVVAEFDAAHFLLFGEGLKLG